MPLMALVAVDLREQLNKLMNNSRIKRQYHL